MTKRRTSGRPVPVQTYSYRRIADGATATATLLSNGYADVVLTLPRMDADDVLAHLANTGFSTVGPPSRRCR